MVKNNVVEEWLPTHHPDYDVSNLGRIRSQAQWRHLGLTKILRGSVSNGYPSVGFWPEATRHLVHILVMRAFVGPCPEDQEVMHKDDDRLNARLDNLEYGTHLQNVQDCIARGRQKRRKLTDLQVREIRLAISDIPKTGPNQRPPNGTYAFIGTHYGVTGRCIEAVWKNQNYKNA